MDFWKKTLPQIIAFFTGLVVILSFFSGPGAPRLKGIEEEVWKWIQIIISFSMILGVISLVSLNVRKIVHKAPNCGYNAVLLGAFFAMTGLSLFIGLEPTYRTGDTVMLMSDIPGRETATTVLEVRPASPTGILLQIQLSAASSNDALGLTSQNPAIASFPGASGSTSQGADGAVSTAVPGLTTSASFPEAFASTSSVSSSPSSTAFLSPAQSATITASTTGIGAPTHLAGPQSLTVSAKKVKTLAGYRAWQAQYVLFYGVFKAGQATLFSLLAFFMASAVYRAFRVRTRDSCILLGSALIVMLGNIPLGNLISSTIRGWGIPFPGFSEAREWILSFPSSAAQSAILIGAVLGYLASALKNLLGIETAFLGIKKP